MQRVRTCSNASLKALLCLWNLHSSTTSSPLFCGHQQLHKPHCVAMYIAYSTSCVATIVCIVFASLREQCRQHWEYCTHWDALAAISSEIWRHADVAIYLVWFIENMYKFLFSVYFTCQPLTSSLSQSQRERKIDRV